MNNAVVVVEWRECESCLKPAGVTIRWLLGDLNVNVSTEEATSGDWSDRYMDWFFYGGCVV